MKYHEIQVLFEWREPRDAPMHRVSLALLQPPYILHLLYLYNAFFSPVYILTMSSRKPTLSVQINQIDYTLVQPGFLDDSSLHRVPILRIYGASSVGKKTCVHVHQVYPYFFVEYTGKMTPDIGEWGSVLEL
jgi:hypothetical protein